MSSNITVVFHGPEPSNILKSIVLPLNAETISVTNSLEQLQKQVNDYLTECIQSTQSNNVQGMLDFHFLVMLSIFYSIHNFTQNLATRVGAGR